MNIFVEGLLPAGSFFFYFIFKLYNIVLVLPNIEMNPPQVYPCSPSWTLLPPPSPTLPPGRPSAPAPSIQYRASNLDWQLISYIILYMFQCYSPKSPHPLPLPESIRLIYTSVSLLLSCTQGYCYHLSKFHMYVLVYCIGKTLVLKPQWYFQVGTRRVQTGHWTLLDSEELLSLSDSSLAHLCLCLCPSGFKVTWNSLFFACWLPSLSVHWFAFSLWAQSPMWLPPCSWFFISSVSSEQILTRISETWLQNLRDRMTWWLAHPKVDTTTG